MLKLIISIILSVLTFNIIHESGHFLCGLIAGYKPVFFSIYGKAYLPGRGKLLNNKGVLGQCVMIPKIPESKQDPFLLICGGIIGNFAAAAVFLTIMIAGPVRDIISSDTGMSLDMLFNLLAVLIPFAINLAAGISNLIPSGTNDGANLRESFKHRVPYNNLMYVYAYCARGNSFADMPSSIFRITDQSKDSSFVQELHEYYEYATEESEVMSGRWISGKKNDEKSNDSVKEIKDLNKLTSREVWNEYKREAHEECSITKQREDEYTQLYTERINNELFSGEWICVRKMIEASRKFRKEGGPER